MSKLELTAMIKVVAQEVEATNSPESLSELESLMFLANELELS